MMRILLHDLRRWPIHKQVWLLAAPMIVSNLTVPLVTLVDTMVAGHLPQTEQLAAVTVGGAIFTLLAGVCGFLRMGTIGFTAQAFGAGNGNSLRTVLAQSIALGCVLGIVLAALTWPLLPWVLARMKSDPALQHYALIYLAYRLPSLPVVLISYALTGWFMGIHKPRVAFMLLLWTNLVNIALNLLFVLVFHWDVAGIAAASSISAVGGVIYGLWRIRPALLQQPGTWIADHLRRWRYWQRLLSVNGDIFIRSLALQGVFFALTIIGTRLGSEIVAANALLLNGLMLASFALDGLANAVEAMSGKAIGARDAAQLRASLLVSGAWSVLGSVLFAVFFMLCGHWFINVQTNIAHVRAVAYIYLPYLALLPLIAVWSFLLDGLFVGATRAREMRNCMLLSALCFLVLCGLLLPFENHGLWTAFLAFMAFRGLSMAYVTRRISRRQDWFPVAKGGTSGIIKADA